MIEMHGAFGRAAAVLQISTVQPVRARLSDRGDQVVEVVVDHGYRPHSIVARAGMPLRLVFHRRDDDPCMDRIVFSSPHLDRRLARGTATTITLPAQPAGEIRFACGMGRYHGEIEVRAGSPSSFGTLRAAVANARRLSSRLLRGPFTGHGTAHGEDLSS